MHCTADLVDIAEATKGKVCIIKPDSLQPAGFSSDKVIQAPAAIEPFPPSLGNCSQTRGSGTLSLVSFSPLISYRSSLC